MAQIRAPVIALLMLLAVALFATQTSARPSRRCCMSYSSSKPPMDRIRGFSIQTIKGPCNINAIIFHTEKGKEMCVDPKQAWVMLYVSKLREIAAKLQNKTSQA